MSADLSHTIIHQQITVLVLINFTYNPNLRNLCTVIFKIYFLFPHGKLKMFSYVKQRKIYQELRFLCRRGSLNSAGCTPADFRNVTN